jgi:hypothetical protein
MFGCTAIYVGEKIVLILRQKASYERDNGVWMATTREHHSSLEGDFPNMRSIELLGEPVTNWQLLPIDAPDFAGDPRIGRIPGKKRRSQNPLPGAKATRKSKQRRER